MNEDIAFQAAFKDVLDNTVIPADMPILEQEKMVQKLFDVVQEGLPKALFRYRKCNERSFEAFDSDRMWVSRADCMNDGFDSRMFFDRKEILAWRDWLISDEYTNSARLFFLEMNIPKSATDFPGIEQLVDTVRDTTEDEFRQFIIHHKDFVTSNTEKFMAIVSGAMQMSNKFCCLSENISSSAMWGHYSENESGFALSYVCHNLDRPELKDQNVTCSCFPVIYEDTRYKVSADYVKFMLRYSMLGEAMANSGYSTLYPLPAQSILKSLPCPDIFECTKVALHKSNEWAYEKEWRMFCSSIDKGFSEEPHASFIMKPTAIYLGRRISKINEKILISMAQEKNLPIYKMELDDESFSYDLIPRELSV